MPKTKPVLTALLLASQLCGCAFHSWSKFDSAREAYEECLAENLGDEEACASEHARAEEAFEKYEAETTGYWNCDVRTEGCTPRGPAVDR